MTKVSIITINYNGYRETAELLDSVKASLKQHSYRYEMIVVDNASATDDAARLEKEYPWVKVVKSDRNLGFSGGNNLGVKHAGGDYYLFINNDVTFDTDMIEPLLACFARSEKIGAVSPSIYDSETHRLIFSGVRPLGKFLIRINYIEEEAESQEIPLAIGTAVMVRKKVYDQTGGWPELYFLYEEELDWSLNIVRCGYTIWYEKDSAIYHKGSMTTGKESLLQQYYLTRNRLLLYKRNLTGFRRVASIAFYLLIAFPQLYLKRIQTGKTHLIKPSLEGILDFFRGKVGYSSRNFQR